MGGGVEVAVGGRFGAAGVLGGEDMVKVCAEVRYGAVQAGHLLAVGTGDYGGLDALGPEVCHEVQCAGDEGEGHAGFEGLQSLYHLGAEVLSVVEVRLQDIRQCVSLDGLGKRCIFGEVVAAYLAPEGGVAGLGVY